MKLIPDIKCKGIGCPLKDKCMRADYDSVAKFESGTQYRYRPFTIDDKGIFSCELFYGDEFEILKYNLKKIKKDMSPD